jgi:hypothetical protein
MPRNVKLTALKRRKRKSEEDRKTRHLILAVTFPDGVPAKKALQDKCFA